MVYYHAKSVGPILINGQVIAIFVKCANCLFVCLLSALASAFTVPTPASQGSLLICASPVYSKGECRSTSLTHGDVSKNVVPRTSGYFVGSVVSWSLFS